MTITIVSTGAESDAGTLQSAIWTQTDPDIVLIGRFNFPRTTIRVTRPVSIRAGEPAAGDTYGAYIHGGGELVVDGPPDQGPHAFYGAGHAGVFLVRSGNGAVQISGIAFDDFQGPAIFAESCNGLTVRGCRFTSPLPGVIDMAEPAVGERPFKFVSAIWAGGPSCTAEFVAENNEYDAGVTYDEDDDQIIVCGQSSFSSVRILGNTIRCHDEAIEVLCNRVASRVVIDNNVITVSGRLGEYFGVGGHAAVVCAKNGTPDLISVGGNNVTTHGSVVAFVLTGSGFYVSGNTVNQLPSKIKDPSSGAIEKVSAPAAFILGLGKAAMNLTPQALSTLLMPDGDLGPSFSESSVVQNTLTGEAGQGFLLLDWVSPLDTRPPDKPRRLNSSHKNFFSGNDLSQFTCVHSVVLGPHTHDNLFCGSFPDAIPGGVNNHFNTVICMLPKWMFDVAATVWPRPPGPWSKSLGAIRDRIRTLLALPAT